VSQQRGERAREIVTATFESALRRDRAIVVTGLGALVAVAWLHLVQMARDMAQMEGHAAMGMVMPQMQPWSRAELLYLFVMWSVMMVAMMTPSATPMILMFSAMNRRRAERRGPVVRTGLFVLGYLIAWIGYSAGAAVAQWVLHGRAALSPAMVSTSPYLGGGLLVAAGIFQWTPLKRACLTACRSPMGFLMTEWREGGAGALIMGVRYGVRGRRDEPALGGRHRGVRPDREGRPGRRACGPGGRSDPGAGRCSDDGPWMTRAA
jgi:predicted metal-binding membrane protein